MFRIAFLAVLFFIPCELFSQTVRGVQRGTQEAFRAQFSDANKRYWETQKAAESVQRIRSGEELSLSFFKVEQVVDGNNARISMFNTDFWVTGNTKGWIDGERRKAPILISAKGSKTYSTALGSIRTVTLLEMVGDAEIARRIEAENRKREKLAAARALFEKIDFGNSRKLVKARNKRVLIRDAKLVGYSDGTFVFESKKSIVWVKKENLVESQRKALGSIAESVVKIEKQSGVKFEEAMKLPAKGPKKKFTGNGDVVTAHVIKKK